MTNLPKQLVTLIQKWAANLGISDYKFDFKLVPDRQIKGDYANIDTDEDTREVTIEFNKARLLKESGEIEKTVIHELLHTRMNEYAEFVLDIIRSYVNSPKTRQMLQRRLDKIEHKVIVALTDALSKEK